MKKLILLAMAVGAMFVYAIPTSASAATLLTTSTGGSPTSVTVTQDPSNVVQISTPLGVTTCEAIDFGIDVTKNTETEAKGNGTSGKFSTKGCLAGGLVPIEITNIEVSSISFTNKTVGSATLLFTEDIPALGLSDCNLHGTVGLAYAHKTNTVTITSPNALTGGGGSASCPTSGTIKGSFILEETSSPFNPITFS